MERSEEDETQGTTERSSLRSPRQVASRDVPEERQPTDRIDVRAKVGKHLLVDPTLGVNDQGTKLVEEASYDLSLHRTNQSVPPLGPGFFTDPQLMKHDVPQRRRRKSLERSQEPERDSTGVE